MYTPGSPLHEVGLKLPPQTNCCIWKTGKIVWLKKKKKNHCQGKTREFYNFAQTRGTLYAQVVNSLIQKNEMMTQRGSWCPSGQLGNSTKPIIKGYMEKTMKNRLILFKN